MTERMLSVDSGMGARRLLNVAGRVLGAAVLLMLVVDGVISVALGSRWLEMQRTNTPPWYARLPAALQRLPDPVLRALGGVQAAAGAAGLRCIK